MEMGRIKRDMLNVLVICNLMIFLLISFMCEVNIATINVNGARDMRKRATVFELLKQKKIDITMLQETHSDVKIDADWVREWDGLPILSHNTSLSGGVAILFSRNFTPDTYQVDEIIKGRILKVRACFDKLFFVFICVYGPTACVERMLFLNSLCSALQDCDENDYVVLGGDFNCTESNLDRNHIEPHMPSRNRLIQLLKTHELCDIWRQLSGLQRQYTWTHVRDNVISLARLDRFYFFKHHCNIVKKCMITPTGFSDHSMVQCNVVVNPFKPKSAYWQFNASLLSDKYFKEMFEVFWSEFRNTKGSFSSLRQWWDFGKVQIKQFCMQYNQNVTKETISEMNILEIEILKLQELAEVTGDLCHLDSLRKKKNQLAELLGRKTQGALIRSRFLNLNQMDAPSKFFFNLERKNGQSRVMHVLRSETGVLLTDPAEIRKRANSFYEELYKNELGVNFDDDSVFFDNLPQLSQEASTEISDALSMGEVYKALQGMEVGKAPGIDGLPVDFYKSFWSVLCRDLLDVLNESLKEGQLPLSCRRAVLTLLPKKGDLTEIKCWRPVSLLCSEFKLLSKTLANRLSRVIDGVIHSDQTYCVPGRSIFDNISLIRDVFEISRIFNLNCGLISLDQEKAFDRVEHCYLWRVLEAFGFGQTFINYIKVLYSGAQSLLKVNGNLCAPFNVYRGIRQGCSLSGMLYSLAIEPLLNQVRAKLQGFSLPFDKGRVILSAYADDVVVMVNGQDDVKALSDLLTSFKSLSSARVNWGKSEALFLGNGSNEKPKLPEGLNWGSKGFKYLGVFLGDEVTMQRNWEGVVEKVKGRLSKWKRLMPMVSYRGRILIINNLIASSLWHKLKCVDPPLQLLSKIQALLVDFFWDKMHWVSQSILFLPKEEGGQGLVHLQSKLASFRLVFVQRLLFGPTECKWCAAAFVILHKLENLGLDKTLFLMDPGKMNLSILPVFYRNILKVWSLFHFKKDLSPSLYWLLKEPLVYGSRLDVSTDVCIPGFSRSLISSGIFTLEKVLEITGTDFKNEDTLAQRLGFRSVRVIAQLLQKWQSLLCSDEKLLLAEYYDGHFKGNITDIFPDLIFSLNLRDVYGVFFYADDLSDTMFSSCTGKLLYRFCVIAFCKKLLNMKVDTPWRAFFKLDTERKPEWRAIYKPPLVKKVGDLQWRILHGIVAVNAFVSILNSEVEVGCPFCNERETVFHAFLSCDRLQVLFLLLGDIFKKCNELFSPEVFILGFKYVAKKKFLCQLLNFVLGQAKMAIYMSRKRKMEQNLSQDSTIVFAGMVKARVTADFNYYKMVNDIITFEGIWCCKEALCVVLDDDLFFTF